MLGTEPLNAPHCQKPLLVNNKRVLLPFAREASFTLRTLLASVALLEMRVPLFRMSALPQGLHQFLSTPEETKPSKPKSVMRRTRAIVDDPELSSARKEMILVVDYPGQGRVLERVEAVISLKKSQRVLKIFCVPEGEPEDGHVPDVSSVSSAEDSLLSEPEYPREPREPSFLEQLAGAVLDPCQCQSLLKPALRKERRHELASRSVSFDTIDIKEFPMTLGDHPSAATGPPVTLDWEKVARERCIALDEYEASRSPRRNRKQLKLSMRDRKGILQKQFTAEEVNKAWSEAKAIREQRRETIQRGMMMMFLDDMIETTNRRMNAFAKSLIVW